MPGNVQPRRYGGVGEPPIAADVAALVCGERVKVAQQRFQRRGGGVVRQRGDAGLQRGDAFLQRFALLGAEVVQRPQARRPPPKRRHRVQRLLARHRIGTVGQRGRVVRVVGMGMDEPAVVHPIAEDAVEQRVSALDEALVGQRVDAETAERDDDLIGAFDVLSAPALEITRRKLKARKAVQRLVHDVADSAGAFAVGRFPLVGIDRLGVVIRGERLPPPSP